MNNKLEMRSQFDSGVYQTYCQSKNYEAIELNPQSNLCVIYFSSNGLYYPDTAAVFHQVVAVKDRYEWKKNIVQSARKVIFVRDVQKQWYVEGINSQVNSIEKLCTLLKAESQGLDVVCVGNSAGGYAAVLVGCKLNAARIFSLSGQFSLLHQLEGEFARSKNPTLVKYENVDGYKQNYLLIDLIKTSKVPILYFYPAKSVKDRMQAELVRDIPHVYSFAFDSKNHANTCWRINFVDLFPMDLSNLLKLHHAYAGKIINPYIFSNRVSGYLKTARYSIDTLLKKINLFWQKNRLPKSKGKTHEDFSVKY